MNNERIRIGQLEGKKKGGGGKKKGYFPTFFSKKLKPFILLIVGRYLLYIIKLEIKMKIGNKIKI